MWIDELRIDGFARVTGTFEFDHGLTVVSGRNESGKSTLHEALLRSMFGFSRSERRRYRGTSDLSSWAPWSSSAFGMTAVAHTSARSLRIEWSFLGDEYSQALRLWDENTGEEITNQVLEKHGDTNLGRFLLGLEFDEYCQVCAVDQAAIGAVERSDSLIDSLRRAAEVGTAEVGVDAALEIMAASLRGPLIGARRDNLAPLASGALAHALAREEELSVGLSASEESRAALRDLAVSLSAAQERRNTLDSSVVSMEQELALSRRDSLRTRLEAARVASETADPGIEESDLIEPQVSGDIQGLLANEVTIRGRIAESDHDVEAVKPALAELQSQVADCDQDLRALAPFELIDASCEATVRDLLPRLDELKQEQPIQLAQDEPPGSSSEATPWIVAGTIAVASGVVAALVGPIALAGVVLAVAAFFLIRDSSRSSQANKPHLIVPSADREATLLGDLEAALDAASAPTAGTPEERARAYLIACEKHAKWQRTTALRAELTARKADVSQPLRDMERLAGELADVTGQLHQKLGGLGIDADEDSAAERFRDLLRADRIARDAGERAGGAQEALDAALGGRTLEELEADANEAERTLREHTNRYGTRVTSAREEARVEERLTATRLERTALEGELGGVEQQISTLEAELQDVPAWREERETLQARVQRLRSAAEAITIARRELGEAASESHRRFAPVLNEAIAVDLPGLTSGRYRRARVSNELQITLEAPETGSLVPAEDLSRGTQDQIYLVERLAIMKVLSGSATESAPLLLDDAFAFSDEDRLRGGLELLGKESEDRQVILFVDDAAICDALTDLTVPHKHIELPAPAGTAA